MTENKNNPLVSIVVPIYNSEKYLNQCIESIVNQTYKKIEILLIDDGSTDNSYYVCEKWQKSDNRIKLIRKENEGLSVTRNLGTSKSSGDYVLYIDSDDWVSPALVETVVNAATKKKADMVVFRFVMVNEDGNQKKMKSEPFEKLLTSEECLEMLLNRKAITNHPWRYLYSKRIALKIDFPKNRVYEDMFTTYRRIVEAEAIYCINDELYYYRENPSGIYRTFSFSSMNDLIDGTCERCSYICNNYPGLKTIALYDKEYRLVRVFNRLLKQGITKRFTAEYKSTKDRICSEIRDLPVDPKLDESTKKEITVLQKHPGFAELYCYLLFIKRFIHK